MIFYFMGNEKIGRGEAYRLFSKDEYRFLNLIGVREETLSDNVKYATFFSVVHDIFAAQNLVDFSFCRNKIPIDNLEIGENNCLIRSRGIKVKNIWYDEKMNERSDLMKSWLNECGDILKGMGCVDVEDIFRGKKTWERNSRAYGLFGDGYGKQF
jgi:hypothetical protein